MPKFLDFSDTNNIVTPKKPPKDREINSHFDIIKIIEEAFQETSVKNRNGRISPTSGVGFCPRMSFRNANEKIEETNGACNKYWFSIGNLSEEIYIEGFKKSGHYIADQIRLTENTPCTKDLKLGGYLDILVKDNDNNLLIVEKKTCGTTIPSSPKKMYEAQLMTYMCFYGLNGSIVYQSRLVGDIYNNLSGRQFDYTYNQKDAISHMSGIFYARLCIDNNLLPNIPINMKKTECLSAYCPFIDNCWNNFKIENNYESISTDKEFELMTKANELAKDFVSIEKINYRREDLFKKVNIRRKEVGLKRITKSNFYKILGG